jgi:hypothetical protein
LTLRAGATGSPSCRRPPPPTWRSTSALATTRDIETGGRSLRIDLGGGNDYINLPDAGPDRVEIQGGPGRDYIFLYFAFPDTVNVNAGAGDDYVSVWYCYIRRESTLDGGPGGDALSQFEPGFWVPPRVMGFESRMPMEGADR